MESTLGAVVVIAGVTFGSIWVLVAFVVLTLALFGLFFYWLHEVGKKPSLQRLEKNPLMRPATENWWESEAVFNPAAVVHDGKVHLFYRALGRDGVSRLGYAISSDGIHFERLPHPAYAAENISEARSHYPYTSPARLTYDTVSYGSGGGWGGCEDPRAVKLDGRVYVTFNMFSGWYSMRVALTSIAGEDLTKQDFNWRQFRYLSHPQSRHKNWVLFPEKIGGRYALFHNVHDENPSRVQIEYVDTLDEPHPLPYFESPDPQQLPDREVAWHNRTRSAGPPPIKTNEGWLLFYHAMDKNDPNRYKLGALLLDLKDPRKILYRSSAPILAPDAWYENDWKPGIIYVSGAVVFNGDLILYYGGGDKHVAAAKANLRDFLRKLTHNEHAVFEPVKM